MLGRTVEQALEYLTARGRLHSRRWLRNFPHPSGANGHRKPLFEEHKAELRIAAQRWLACVDAT